MALTLDIEQRLEAAGLIAFYGLHQAAWLATARRAKQFLQATFPPNSQIRPDDLRKAILPIVEVDEDLQGYLDAEKLKQKYWYSHFTDLIVERTWPHI
jgi:hypothetical protein